MVKVEQQISLFVISTILGLSRIFKELKNCTAEAIGSVSLFNWLVNKKIWPESIESTNYFKVSSPIKSQKLSMEENQENIMNYKSAATVTDP